MLPRGVTFRGLGGVRLEKVFSPQTLLLSLVLSVAAVTAELATMPQLGAALLLDRFLAAIYPHGPDLHRLLGIDDEAKGPPAV